MATVLYGLHDGYKYLFEDPVNPMTRDWFLVGKPLQMFSLLAGYLYFCTNLGPRYMKDKKPLNLKNVIAVYNLFQIVMSLYIFYEATVYVFCSDFNLCCQGLNDPKTTHAIRIANAVWVFYMIKVIDLMDTVFFVLRKSNRQITSLHLHHHTLMVFAGWIASTYIPGGQTVLIGYINSLVHAVMYTYYLLAGLGDKYKEYLWWKKYLTMLQLVQFFLLGIHTVNSLFYPCSYPVILKILTFAYCIIFTNLFGNFYYKSYVKKNNTTNEIRNGKSNKSVKIH